MRRYQRELTDEQIRMCALVAEEWPDQMIADEIGCSLTAAKQRLLQIRSILGVHSRVGVAVWYERHWRRHVRKEGA